ncbi:phosphoribosylformylglycinamidine synthase subunit PurQ [bacterium]|nr:phosphoribosylformylglycinamidine synthase subunit PurQ [bacterium]MBU1636703.1 phosphoribosylformylglycinamidine synthase subunit PurQ [bacterium]RQV99380.1 MAG: phosphoribosylformylglycinamidine synthase subunit PurQ [bacterium]
MKVAVVTFPGSNCDRDCIYVMRDIFSCEVHNVFHKEASLCDCDAVIIPGGFSYGDYLRAGALAKYSPVMKAIQQFAKQGGLVIGICNGFQILCEVGLLPGALVRNRNVRFISRNVELRVENTETAFTSAYEQEQLLWIPIAHAEGNYVADDKTIEELESSGRVVFRYTGPKRQDVPDGNPNGSINSIAGIINEQGNVLGMMPHPERASDERIGSTDGLGVFRSMITSLQQDASYAALTV